MRSGDGEPALWLGDAEGIVPLLPLAGPVPGGPGDAAFASPDLVQRERSS